MIFAGGCLEFLDEQIWHLAAPETVRLPCEAVTDRCAQAHNNDRFIRRARVALRSGTGVSIGFSLEQALKFPPLWATFGVTPGMLYGQPTSFLATFGVRPRGSQWLPPPVACVTQKVACFCFFFRRVYCDKISIPTLPKLFTRSCERRGPCKFRAPGPPKQRRPIWIYIQWHWSARYCQQKI